MDQLKLESSLRVKSPAVISFYGAGGKTTLMYRLAGELRSSGRKVLLTTTTQILIPPELPLFIDHDPEQTIDDLTKHFESNSIAVLGKKVLSGNKIEGLAAEDIQPLRDDLQVTVLVEADGSRGLPIKGYASYEPVLPPCSDIIAAVVGADALGENLSADIVHRPAEFTMATGLKEGSVITELTLAAAFREMLRLGHSQAPGAAVCFILNKSDLLKDPAATALQLHGLLSDLENPPGYLLLTAGNENNPVWIIMNFTGDKQPVKVSCVVLAAGTSSRMGEDKLSLPFRGKTILEHTLDQITEAGIDNIIVVIRPGSPWPEKLKSRDLSLIENPLYITGIASSLRAGLAEVHGNSQGVIFALADQPLVAPSIYRELIDRFQHSLSLVTYPVYQGRRGNPALFDRRTWSSLMLLAGDRGGRAVINELGKDQIEQVETDLPAVVTDIDTPENYRNLLT